MATYMHAANPNAKKAALKDRKGNPNIVALFRRTRKGQRLVVGGKAVGVEGRDGSDYYEIRLGADGVLYCACGDYKGRGHKWNRENPGRHYACKHIGALLEHFAGMVDRGVSVDSEAVIYRPEVLLAEAHRRVAAGEPMRTARRTA